MDPVNLEDLEKKVKAIFMMHPKETIELSGLPEATYELFKKIFSRDYEVNGTINILDSGTRSPTYILHIRRIS